MNLFLKLSLGLLLFFSLVPELNAREWRGIVPLKSTRTDVIRLLNRCSDQTEACAFTEGNEDVYILFSNGSETTIECTPSLAAETVLVIHIWFKTPVKISSLQLDIKKLESQSYGSYKEYFDLTNGLDFETDKDEVLQIAYLGTLSARGSCSGLGTSPRSFVAVERLSPPTILMSCTSKDFVAGDKIEVSAWSPSQTPRGFRWAVSAGKIVSGPRLKRAVIDTSGVTADSIVVYVELDDGPDHHPPQSSCEIKRRANLRGKELYEPELEKLLRRRSPGE